MSDLAKNKKFLVVGLARSGAAAARLLVRKGAAEVIVCERKEASQLGHEPAEISRLPAVRVVTGGNPPELVEPSLAAVIKSPGVPPSLELFQRAAELGVPVWSEVELAYAFLRAPLLGVTGTNGKTTTTALLAAIMKEARFDPVLLGGNIGNPLSGLVESARSQGVVVAELSSFQLEDIATFRPAVALFLNFSDDHLDYHRTSDRYFEAKARILENQVAGDYAVLNAGDRAVAALAGRCRGELLWFDRAPVSRGAGMEDDWVALYQPGLAPRRICRRGEMILPGEHNLENALGAAAAAWAAGADPESIGAALCSFRAIEHRLEEVAVIDGVTFINDSKGTNPGATIKALRSFPAGKIVLIAGGIDKGADFGELAAVIRDTVRSLVLLGQTRDLLAAAAEEAGFKNYSAVDDLTEAVALARRQACPGEVVLLSPACASWDMFPNFEVRGDLFKQLVRKGSLDGEEKGHG